MSPRASETHFSELCARMEPTGWSFLTRVGSYRPGSRVAETAAMLVSCRVARRHHKWYEGGEPRDRSKGAQALDN